MAQLWKRCLWSQLLCGLLLIVALVIITEQPAHAYVDPGSGLITFQMLGASVAGALLLVRSKISIY